MIIKLRNRLIGTIMAFVSVIMLIAFIAVFSISMLRIQAENNEKIAMDESIEITTDGHVLVDGQVKPDAVVVNRISPSLGVYFNLLSDQNGELFFIDSALNLDYDIYAQANKIANENPDGGTVELEGRRWQYVSGPAETSFSDYGSITENEYVHIRFLDITDSHKTLETLLFTLIGLYFVLMAVFFVLARYFANRSIKPMAEAWENQRQFIADASHELKTPISTLNTNLDVLYASQEDTIKNQVKWLDNSKKVLDRMTMLIKDMIELAKVDELSEKPQAEHFNVGEVIEAVLDYFDPAAKSKHIEIIENIDAHINVVANHTLLQQVIEILMDNAIKYTDDDGQIRIDAYTERNDTVIRIQNTGAGIAPADVEKIFDRFYRGDKSRMYSDDSYGLGLSIAKAAVQKLGGDISVQSDTNRTCFTVKIPHVKPRRS